jgi:hypothetical protein
MFNGSTETKDRRIGWHYGIRTHSSGFGLNADTTLPKEVDASIVRNPEQPRGKRTAVVVLVQLPISLEQRVLNNVLAVHH